MSFRLTLELSDADLDHFRQVLEASRRRSVGRGDAELVKGARRLLDQARATQMPEFVRKRLDDLRALIAMLEDDEWAPEGEDRERVVAAMSYFADPHDLIPDQIPGIGFLDDALMAELVLRDFKHEFDAYRDFCSYREKEEARRGASARVGREEWLAARRRQLFVRMKRRREERRRHHSRLSPTPGILAYRS